MSGWSPGAVLGGAAAAMVLSAVILGALPIDADRILDAPFRPPGGAAPLGTDGVGRDVLARVLHGGSALIATAGVSTMISVVIGVVLGLATLGTGRPTRVVRAALDLLLTVPALVILLVTVFGIGAGVLTMVIVSTLVNAPLVARFTRALAAPLLHSEWMLAGRASGDSVALLAARDLLPHLLGPLAADAGVRFVSAVYVVAAAAFLGFDPLGDGGDWATMVQEGLDGLRLNPWASLAPAVAILAVTVPTTLAAERLSRAGR